MGLLSKFMSALIGEPYTPKPVSQSAPKPVQQQTTQRRATAAQPRQTQQTRQSYATRPIATVSAIAISRANANHSSLYFFYNESFTFYNESFASAVSVQFAVNAETYAATNAPCRADRTGAKYYRQNRKA